jgi:hypothetical protein
VPPDLQGPERLNALASLALNECLCGQHLSPTTPIILASCNGSAHDYSAESWIRSFDSEPYLDGSVWEKQRVPVVSASCASGLYALYLAQELVNSNCREAIVLAVDIESPSNRKNFLALRLLSETYSAWQPNSSGFALGEGAVAVRVTSTRSDDSLPVSEMAFGNELDEHDGLELLLRRFSGGRPDVVVGQGTGPFEVNRMELNSFDCVFDRSIPLTTTLAHFGHTLGASSLLAVAVAALGIRSDHPLSALSMNDRFAFNGRPLLNGSKFGASAIITCKALNGAIGVAGLNVGMKPVMNEIRAWQRDSQPGPLMHPTLRRIVEEARGRRPHTPPKALIVLMDAPLIPPSRARVGKGILPTAILEITPGFVPQLISRCWGFNGPAFCLVGDDSTQAATWNIIQSLILNGNSVSCVHISGKGMNRDISWNFDER